MPRRRRRSARGSYQAPSGSRSSVRGSWSGSGRPIQEAVQEVRSERADLTARQGGGGESAPAPQVQVPSVAEEDLVRRTKLVGAAFPDLKGDPKSLLALAQQSVPDDELVASTAKTAAWAGIKRQAEVLPKLPDDKQREAWDAYDSSQRKMLRSFGYKPPKKKDEDGGWLDTLTSLGTDLVESIPVVGAAKAYSEGDIGTGVFRTTPAGMLAQPVGKSMKWGQKGASRIQDETEDLPVLDKAAEWTLGLPGKASDFATEKIGKPVLGGLEAVGDIPLHAYRQAKHLGERGMPVSGMDMAGALLSGKAFRGETEIPSPGDVADAWSETDDPSTSFHRRQQREARDILNDNDQLYRLAEGLASGKSIEDLAKKRSGKDIGSKEYQEAYLEISGLSTSDKFKKAIKTLSDGRISPGMDLATASGLDPESGLGQAVVGATDIAFQFIFDPLLIAGKANKAIRLARWGLNADDAINGIKAAQVVEGERLVKNFGDDWVRLASEGKISPRQMVSAGAGRTAFGQEIASAFKANGEWLAARAAGDEEKLRRLGNPLGQLVNKHARLLPAIDDFKGYDDLLRTEKVERRSRELGRTLTEAEARAVPGFESADDVWRFYQEKEGLSALVAGRWARPNATFFELPRLSRTGMARVQAKLGMEKVINYGQNKIPTVDVPLGPDEVLTGNRAVKVSDQLGPVREGGTRLYRVQSGPGLEGAQRGVPDYVRGSERMGFEKAAGRWFTDDLERARAEAAQLGPHARLYSLDVPNEVADAARFSNNPEIRDLAQNPAGEFLLGDEAAGSAGLVGQIGSLVDAKGTMLSPALRFFQTLGKRVPEGGNLPLHGSGFGPEMSRLLDMGLAGPSKERWMQELISSNPATRRSLTRSALDRIFWVNGVYETPEGRDMAQMYLNGIKQGYSPTGKDVITEGTELVRAGILPVGDHADGIAIPHFREILAQSRRFSHLRTVLGETANRPLVDAFMGSYWKPAVLLRLGFIPRAAADEMLASILRMPDVVTNSALWIPLAKNEGQPLWMFKPMAAAARGMQAHLPDSLLGSGTPWTERFANFLTNRATGWVRGMAERRADPGMLEYAREIGRQSAMRRAVMSGENLSMPRSAFHTEFEGAPGGRGGVGAMRSSWLDESELNQDPTGTINIHIDPKNPQAMMKMRPVGSEMVTYTGEDFAFQGMYRWQSERYVQDPVGRATAEALGMYVHPDRANALTGHLDGTRRALAGTPDERYALEFFDSIGDEPSRAVSQIRTAVAKAPDDVRNPLQRFFDMSASDDPAVIKRASAELDAAKHNARRAGDPALVMFTDTAESLPQDLRWGLTVDRDAILGRLRPTPARVEPGAPLPEPTLEDPVTTARQQRWGELAANAEAGDFQSAMDLASEVAYRELQNPANAKYVRESVRSQMKRGGTSVAQPVPDGFTRVYYPVFDSGSIPRVQDTVTNGSQLGRRYASQALLPEGQANIAREMSRGGMDDMVPASRFATADFDEATDLMSEIRSGIGDIPNGRNALRYVDIPDTDVTAFGREAKALGREYGTHDYWLTEGQAYRGKPIDPEAVQRDGLAALPGVTAEDALRDWSNLIAEQGKDLFTSPRNGRFLHEVGTRGAQRGEFRTEWSILQGAPPEDLPREVWGPRRYMPSDNMWQKTTRFGFERVIGPALNSLAREPLWMHYAGARWELAKSSIFPHLLDEEAEAAARTIGKRAGYDTLDDLRQAWDTIPDNIRELRSWDRAEALAALPEGLRGISPDDIAQLRSWVKNRDYAYGEAAQLAAEGAFRDMIPFVDDHRVRSQLSEYIRNLVPFWFAEEQFLKRWAYTLAHSPEGLRRAQLLVGAGKHFGLIQQNDRGEDVFVYPGSAQLNQLLSTVAEKVTGEPYTIPLEVPLTGQLQYATPGFDRLGVPGYSPVVSIPMTLLQRRFPELTKHADEALGRGAGMSLTEQIFPASVMRFVKAFTASPDRDAQYGSAMIQAMQMLEANHLTPAENAGPEVWANYNDRVENWTRILLINRAILGFVGPASPQAQFPGGELSQEFRQMLKSLPLEEASSEFLRKHPDATPYTVFTTKSTSGATLSSSDKALAFMDRNEDLIAAYPQAAAWLLPQSDANEPSNRSAFTRQIQLGLRERKTPKEWQQDFFFSRAADTYFKSRDRYEIARDSTESSQKRKQLDDNWRQWKDAYFNQHPVFAEQLQSREAHNRRVKTLDQMATMLNDERVNERGVEHLGGLREVMRSWQRFDGQLRAMTGDRGQAAQERRKSLRIAFQQWGNAYVARRPRLRAFWRRVIQPEIGLDAGDLYEVV